jgi:FtsH-binding integral membrane protein
MLYQLAGFGTLHYVVPKPINWALNIGILGLIIASYVGNRLGNFALEKTMGGLLVLGMAVTVFYGVLKLRQMQADYDLRCPVKEPK